jgi:hypothetical protein
MVQPIVTDHFQKSKKKSTAVAPRLNSAPRQLGHQLEKKKKDTSLKVPAVAVDLSRYLCGRKGQQSKVGMPLCSAHRRAEAKLRTRSWLHLSTLCGACLLCRQHGRKWGQHLDQTHGKQASQSLFDAPNKGP